MKAETKDLLLAELGIFEESIWRNEQIGETRFNFFMTLVAAVIAGLVALWTAEFPHGKPRWLENIAWEAGLGLLTFGLLTFRRMMHRDRITAEYKETTRYIREHYLRILQDSELAGFEIPRRLDKPIKQDVPRRLNRVSKVGYTPSLGLINGVLLTATLWGAGLDVSVAVPSGIALTIFLLWMGSAPDRNKNLKQTSTQGESIQGTAK
jgi:hypothetical protein